MMRRRPESGSPAKCGPIEVGLQRNRCVIHAVVLRCAQRATRRQSLRSPLEPSLDDDRDGSFIQWTRRQPVVSLIRTGASSSEESELPPIGITLIL